MIADADLNGCVRIRRCTSEGVVAVGGGGGEGGGRRRCGEGVETAIKSWCSARPTIALSSGEADVNALTKATIEGLGVQAEAKDIGWSLCVVVLVDSPTAESTASRSGVWKVRHLESNTLWIQGAARERKIGIRKTTSGPIHRLRAHHAAGFKESCCPRWADVVDEDW